MSERAGATKTVYQERVALRDWTPTWIRYQHVGRYEWILPRVAGLRVADAACGNGYGAAMMAGSAASVDGFDLSEQAVEEARERYGASGAVFTAADILALPRPDACYDAFVSFETIEHLPDTDAYLREIRRVLKPGGTFYCSTPNRLITNPGTSITDKPYNPWHLREFSPAELETALRRVFAEVTLLGQCFFGRPYAGALASIGRTLPAAAVRTHQLRKVASMPFDRAQRHVPQPLHAGHEPEALVAYCR